MDYIVFDLEWNQSSGNQKEVSGIPFEIVEIGAVKLNDEGVMISEFDQLIKPSVYHEMNHITGRLIHLQMRELERGNPFPEVANAFLEWCGEKGYMFCTWGSLDLTELQRNMRFYDMTPMSDGPIVFLDVQKLFSLVYEDGRTRRALENAVDLAELEKDIPFHRAFGDAYYTAKLLAQIIESRPEVLKRVSYDLFHPPVSREKEVKVRFDDYVKYISREFADKTQAFADGEVSASKCYFCHRNLKKKLKWFTINGRHYYCLAYCEKHGYFKNKIRIRKSENGKIFIVKTTKLITEEEAATLSERSERAREIHRHRNKSRREAALKNQSH